MLLVFMILVFMKLLIITRVFISLYSYWVRFSLIGRKEYQVNVLNIYLETFKNFTNENK